MDKDTRERFIQAVEGTNKERDYQILECHALYPELTRSEILATVGLEMHETRVGQILKENSLLILQIFAQINPLYFKEGRVLERVKMYRRKTKGGKEVASGKDTEDILDGIRKETEGDNKTSVGIIIQNKEKDGEVSLSTGDRELQERIRSSLKTSRLS